MPPRWSVSPNPGPYGGETMSNLLTQDLLDRLLENGARTAAGEDTDFEPLAKFFTPDGPATWLISEVDPSDPDRAFGLCDLGLGYPELGYVRLSELAAIRGRLGLRVERDAHFRAERTLAEYARLAAAEGRIIL